VYGCSLFGGWGGPEKGRFVLKQTGVYFFLLLAVLRAGDLLIVRRRLAGDFLPFFTVDLATLFLFVGDLDLLRPFRAAFFGDFDLFRDLDFILLFVVFFGDLDLFLFLGDFDLFVRDFDLLRLLLGDLDRLLTLCFGVLDLFLAGADLFLRDLDLDLDLLFERVLDEPDRDLDRDFGIVAMLTVDQFE
jgi:hypothetical protein